MPTLRAAAQLLAEAGSLDTLAPIAALAGCPGTPAPVPEHTLRELGLLGMAAEAHVAVGPGALRALMLVLQRRIGLREAVARAAHRLTARASHSLWLLVATQRDTDQLAIAAWQQGRRAPRVSALLVDRRRVVASDAESLVALAAAGAGADARDGADLLLHARWVELLGREALTRRFYRTLEHHVHTLAASSPIGSDVDRSEAALLLCSRLLFLAFLEAKGWLDGDREFLIHGFDRCMAAGGRYQQRVLAPLFFGTLNTPPRARAPRARAFGRVPFLNGGLFGRSAAERRCRGLEFRDDAIGALYAEVFARYRFTAREESTEWTEVAIDPEMLGKTFESLMASTARRSSGSFYTPFALVERATALGLQQLIEPSAASPPRRQALGSLTVLDPACGSGAFLVHALERIADLLRETGDPRPVAVVRRAVLTRSIYGVDRDPTAVWTCELRLWLSVVIESDIADPLAVPPLPNLDRNIRVGDSLADAGFEVPHSPRARGGGGRDLRRLRDRYARASGRRKEALAGQLDREERRLAVARVEHELQAACSARTELVRSLRRRDLFGERHRPTRAERATAGELRARVVRLRAERRRLQSGGALPFSFPVHFADVAARGGFDLVLGNPPWVRLHRIPPAVRESLRRDYRVFRFAAWESGASRAMAGRGFAAQADLSAAFVERALQLLRPRGALSFLLPVKLWHSLAGGGVRRLLLSHRLVSLEDLSAGAADFDASVYPSIVVARRASGAREGGRDEVAAAVRRGGDEPLRWSLPIDRLPLDATPGSPWLVLPVAVREAFDRVAHCGLPLGDGPIGRPLLGVKCGLNAAYVVRLCRVRGDGIAEVETASGRRGTVEAELLRPIVRGEGLRSWGEPRGDECVLWTHGPTGAPLERLPPHAAHWLGGWRNELSARSDARRARWWSLFRTEAARVDRPRVVWADIGRVPRATVLPAGHPVVPLNSCYVARCPSEDDALALAAILNSPLAAAWLAIVAEPARGAYRRFLGWTMALLPLPREWERARALLVPAARQAVASGYHVVSAAAWLEICLDCYGLRLDEVAPLLEWFAG